MHYVAISSTTTDIDTPDVETDVGGSSSFAGLNWWVVAYMVNMILTGLLISALLKYSGAITKLFSFAASTIVLTISLTFLGIQPPPGPVFLLGAVVVFTSIFSFYAEPTASTPKEDPDQNK
jgi:hypothetical protein